MKPIPKPMKSKTKSLKGKCISLAIKIAKHNKTCIASTQYCHNGFMSRLIDGAHIIGRAQSSRTAARTDNILPLCRECHRYYTDNPDEWKAFADRILPGRRQTLEAVARSQPKVKVDWQNIFKGLQDEAKLLDLI